MATRDEMIRQLKRKDMIDQLKARDSQTTDTPEEAELRAKANAPLPSLESLEQARTPKWQSALQGAASSASFDLDDEVGGLVTAAAKGITGNGFDYAKERDAIRASKAQLQAANPKSYLAGGLAAGIATPGAAAKGATMGAKALSGAKIGAAQGSVSGFGASDEKDLPGQLGDTVKGGILGSVLGAGGGAITKANPKGTVDSVKEMASVGSAGFKEGAKAAKELPILGDLPVIGSGPAQAIGGTIKAAKDLVEQNGNKREFKFMVDEFRKSFGPGSRHDWSDEDVVTMMLMQDGNNAAKNWVAQSSSAMNGIEKSDILNLLDKSPETTKAQRLFNKMDEGENLTGTVDEAFNELKGATSAKYGQLKETAKGEFGQVGNEPIRAISDAMAYAQTRKGIGGVNNVLSNVFDDLVGDGTKGFQSLEPGEQFERILKAKQDVGKAVKWASQNELPEGQKLLQDVYDSLGSHIKKFDSMQQADSTYSTFKGVEESLFKPMAEVRQGNIVGFDPIKIEKIFGQSDNGRHILKGLEKAKALLAEGKLEQGQAASLSKMIASVEGMVENAQGKRAIESFRQRTSGPSGPAIDRLGASIRKDSTLDSMIRTPEKGLRTREAISDLAPEIFNKGYKELNEAEQMAVIKYHSWLAGNEKSVPAERARKLNEILASVGVAPK